MKNREKQRDAKEQGDAVNFLTFYINLRKVTLAC